MDPDLRDGIRTGLITGLAGASTFFVAMVIVRAFWGEVHAPSWFGSMIATLLLIGFVEYWEKR